MYKIFFKMLNKSVLYQNETLIMNNLLKNKLIRYELCTTNINALKCWKCNSTYSTPTIFCETCNIIQKPVSTSNYFKILGLKEDYNVDLKEISQKYRKMQSYLHPDKYSNKTKEEKDISELYSSIVNKAYNIIQSPIQRGLHLLCLKGEQIDENDKSTDNEFLMEIMEINEQVEEADTPEKLINLNKKNREELENIAKDLAKAFEKNSTIEAKNLLIKMKYFTSISVQINNILREKLITE